MTAKERIISARIAERIARRPEYAERIGISVTLKRQEQIKESGVKK